MTRTARSGRSPVEFRQIAQAALASLESLCAEWLPDGRREGREWKARNPTRGDARVGSFSINLDTGAWADFATGDKGGDAIALYAFLQGGIAQLEAAKALAARLGIEGSPPDRVERTDGGETSRRRSDWEPIIPAPASAGELPKAHPRRGRPQAFWTYRGTNGELLGAVFRFRTSDGGKEVLPCVYARHRETGAQEWRWLAFPDPRPLYGLDRLGTATTVLLVEGEKCAAAAQDVFPAELPTLTWSGGSKAVDKADLAPLAGRKVIIWPDCDAQRDRAGALLPEAEQPGMRAAERLAERLAELGANVRIVAIPAPGSRPSGWDVADAIADGWSADQVRAFVRDNLREPLALTRAAPTIAHASASPPPPSSDPSQELLRSDKGQLLACEHNVRLWVAACPDYRDLHFDDFLSRPRLGDRDWTDADDLDALLRLQAETRVAKLTLGQVRHGVRALAYSRRRDSLREFVERIPPWDGTARIDLALVAGWGAPDNALMRAASRNLLIAMIARAETPGAKVDTLWAFEGAQGIGKSLALRELGAPFHAEITAPVGTTDFMRELQGIWLAEFSELDALRKGEASTIKKLLSAQEDRFVQKYAIHAESYSRRAVAVATTNEARYWQDPTGARRLIPITCTRIDLGLIRAQREQWFAEALAAFRGGATWWEFPDAIRDAQEDRQQVHPWEDLLRDRIANGRISADGMGVTPWPSGWVSSYEILTDWIRVPAAQQTRVFSTTLGHVMRRLGFEPVKRAGGERGWQPVAGTSAESASEVPAQVPTENHDDVPF